MNYIGRKQRIELGSKLYTLSRFERRLLRQWLRWAREQFPNPLQVAADTLARLNLPEPAAAALVAVADQQAESAYRFTGDEIQGLFQTWTGQREILALLLMDGSDLARAEAENVADKVREAHGDTFVVNLILDASGRPDTHPGDTAVAYYQELGMIPRDLPSRSDIDWGSVDRSLVEAHSFRPWELDRLTLSEMVSLYQKHDNTVDPYTAAERIKCYNSLTPLQKLTLAFRQLPD